MSMSYELAAKYLKELRDNPNDHRHGTRTGYSYGCRCERCRQAEREYHRVHVYNREKRYKRMGEVLAEMQSDPNDIHHGTTYGYKCGCRCYRCSTAIRKEHDKTHTKVLSQMKADTNDPRHGTPYGYTCGCRCERCKEAAEKDGKSRDKKVLAEMKADTNDPRHGTIYGYKCGCRCDKCREVAKKYSKQYKTEDKRIQSKLSSIRTREKALAQLQSDPNDKRHGTVTGYRYGCRCDRCKEAYAESFKKRKANER